MTNCLACGGERLSTYLNLGKQPLANSFHPPGTRLPTYPLAINCCSDCWHSQLTVAVDPDLLFKQYIYVSGTTKTLRDYFASFTELALTIAGASEPVDVLDIASNDGSLLAQFKARGHRVQGVDPAENLLPLARQAGIPTEVGYWSETMVARLGRRFDIIVAMNVLGHNADPLAFLNACRSAMKPGCRLWIQTSQANMIANREFDTIYHEHHSFFTARSFQRLADRTGLRVVSGRKPSIHGTSYLWTLAESGSDDGSVAAIEQSEANSGVYDAVTYNDFAANARNTAEFVRRTLVGWRNQGYACIGYGAAAKGNTFLNFAGADLDYIVDDNPMKHGLLTPGRDIPVRPPDALREEPRPIVLLVLAWNFLYEIRTRVHAIRNRSQDRVLSYFPHPSEGPMVP